MRRHRRTLGRRPPSRGLQSHGDWPTGSQELAMYIKRYRDCPEIVAGDNTLLRELLSPHNDPVEARYSLAVARIGPGLSSSPHAMLTTEVYYILQGRGTMHIDGEERPVEPGDAIYIPPQAVQYLANGSPEEIVFVCIVDPAWRSEDEVVF